MGLLNYVECLALHISKNVPVQVKVTLLITLDVIYDTKGYRDLLCHFDLVYDPNGHIDL